MHRIPRHSYRRATRYPNPIDHDSFGRCRAAGVVGNRVIQAHRLVYDGVEELDLGEVGVGEFPREGLSKDC